MAGMGSPRSLVDRLVGLCFSLLVGAVALYFAVQLIEAIWTALLVILGVCLFIGVAVQVLRSRSNGW
jgi:hypothetical protein